jgi:hypothetical protein
MFSERRAVFKKSMVQKKEILGKNGCKNGFLKF